ncbi:DUF4157 domain-containing protein [Cellulomonas sp. Leaf334]|uniref:eCIS core domain-containing protein n=1 Tax=Cellulomonas sp. Leaf334 TaxID=1736339 RepID=UPI0006F71C32|nr:DUF4157 domain-containing protein [Cellulomonas sp. Leaf334]KQR15997.1 hypothetical protein ASF78_00685 [Cellulomonas sp. Leaf334]
MSSPRALAEREPGMSGPDRRAGSVAAGGAALDSTTRRAMEAGFSHDFSTVRVHADERAGTAARGLRARAFTVGTDVVFAPGAYRPATAEGRRLVAHELAHVAQQAAGPAGVARSPVTRATGRGHPSEREADTAAATVLAGGRFVVHERPPAGAQCEDEAEKQPGAGEEVVKGLSKLVDKAKDDPKIRKEIIEPATELVTGPFSALSGGEKGALIGFGAATYGLGIGSLLADPSGRQKLQGFNLATPLTLVPYATLTKLDFQLPDATNPNLRFRTAFDLGDLIKLSRGWKGLSLTADLSWSWDPAAERLSLAGGTAKLGLLPGLSVSGGTFPSLLQLQPAFAPPELPGIGRSRFDFGEAPKIPDTRIMLNIDLLKLPTVGDALKKMF